MDQDENIQGRSQSYRNAVVTKAVHDHVAKRIAVQENQDVEAANFNFGRKLPMVLQWKDLCYKVSTGEKKSEKVGAKL